MSKEYTMKIIILIVLLAVTANFSAVSRKTYSLSGGYSTLYDGVGRDWEGNIYIGGGNSGTYDAALFKFNFGTDGFDMVAQVQQVSKAVNNWLSNDYAGKIHTSIKQGIDGKMYFASHRSEDNTAYQPGYRGGHFYSYDPKTNVTVDLSAPGVGADSQGIMDIALGLQYNYVYGVDEDSKLWKQNVVTHKSTYIWDSFSSTRNIFSDNRGRLFSPTSFGRFLIHEPRPDPANDTFYISRVYNLTFQNSCKRIPAVVKSASGDSVYFAGTASGISGGRHIWRYIVPTDEIEDMGLIDPSNTEAETFAMALRWDLNKLYFVSGSRLISIHVVTKARATEYSGVSGTLSGSNGVDRDGNLWFTQKHKSNTVHKFTLGIPCTVCKTKLAYLDSAKIAMEEQPRVSTLGNEILLNVFPSPMKSRAILSFRDPAGRSAQNRLAIYTLTGKSIKKWTFRSSGSQMKIAWLGENSYGTPVSNGIYVVRLSSGTLEKSRYLVVLR